MKKVSKMSRICTKIVIHSIAKGSKMNTHRTTLPYQFHSVPPLCHTWASKSQKTHPWQVLITQFCICLKYLTYNTYFDRKSHAFILFSKGKINIGCADPDSINVYASEPRMPHIQKKKKHPSFIVNYLFW